MTIKPLLCLPLLAIAASSFIFKNDASNLIVIERNKQATQFFYDEVFNKHNISLIDSVVGADYVEHQTDVHYLANRKGLKKEFSDYFQGFPDAELTVHIMMAENDLVTTQFTITGTHRGKIYGLKPTGRKIKISGVDIIRYKNGKAVEHWGYLEEGKLLTQLGLIKELKSKQ
jgi:predicted ester cyclase